MAWKEGDYSECKALATIARAVGIITTIIIIAVNVIVIILRRS